jgi:MraZ protein
MALTGTYTRSLDEKHRLAVPKKLCEDFRESDLTHLYVAPGTDRSLMLYSPAGFEKFARKMAKQSSNRVEVRNYKRLFYAQAEKTELDSQGRIRIPDRLVDFARLKGEIILLGVHDHAEIWDQEAWTTFYAATSGGFDDIAAKALE